MVKLRLDEQVKVTPDQLFEPGVTARIVKDIRDRMGLTQEQLAKRLGVNQSTVVRWEKGAEPDVEHRRAIARLVGNMPIGRPRLVGVETVKVVGAVQAGQWREAIEIPPNERVTLQLPPDKRFPGVERQAFFVRGPSMNRIYPDGSIIVAVPCIPLGIEPQSGNRVIVQRRDRNDLFEVSVKEYLVDEEGKQWLWPRSTHPEHQVPLQYGDVADKSLDDRVVIGGIVTGSYRPE